MNRAPYNPATQGPQVPVHDRRATDISRGHRNRVVETEVEDPYEPGARISAIRSVRDDPLADHLARGHIDEAQFLAGREFQRWFRIAESGPQALQIAEAVDGSPIRESLTDERLKASKWLTRCYGELGKHDSVLVHEMLINNRTARQIARSRGVSGSAWETYFARRLFQCLNDLAIVFGLANGTREN